MNKRTIRTGKTIRFKAKGDGKHKDAVPYKRDHNKNWADSSDKY